MWLPRPKNAAVQVLSALGRVTLSDVSQDDLGRPAEVFDFTSVVVSVDVTDSVPADILASARTQS